MFDNYLVNVFKEDMYEVFHPIMYTEWIALLMATSSRVTLNALREQWGLQRLYSTFTLNECM